MKKTVALFALGLLSLLQADCYNSNGIKNGGLKCGTKDSCPDGFKCLADGHCWKGGVATDAAAVSGPDTGLPPGPDTGLPPGPDTAPPKPDVYVPPACSLPYGPLPKCAPSVPLNSTCDPVCQSGCQCGNRCVLDESTNSTFVCESPALPTGTTFVQPPNSCAGASANLCAPGSVCIPDPQCPSVCYRMCRTNGDCANDARCTASTIVDDKGNPLRNLFLCSPPIKACNPTLETDCGVRGANLKCFFLAGLTGVVTDSSTICDCTTMHDKKLGASCSTLPDDCQVGLACIDGTCRRLCTLKMPCLSATATCTPIYNSPLYGYCR